MDLGLKSKVAIVGGSSKGLGFAIALELAREGKSMSQLEAEIVGTIPLGRLQSPGELANLVVFLASDRASGITGATIQVDGGMLKGLF